MAAEQCYVTNYLLVLGTIGVSHCRMTIGLKQMRIQLQQLMIQPNQLKILTMMNQLKPKQKVLPWFTQNQQVI